MTLSPELLSVNVLNELRGLINIDESDGEDLWTLP
jgi:hypothetical protein